MPCAAMVSMILVLAALMGCQAVTDRPGACKLSDLHVSVARTGKVVAGQPEYRVTIDNQCACAQASVTVRCPGGLPSAEPVDESKIRVESDGLCLINDGLTVARGSPVTFTYAWKTPQDFAVTMAVPHY